MFLKLKLFCILIGLQLVAAEFDDYLDESQQQCVSNKSAISCAKYTALSYLTTFGQQYVGGLLRNNSNLRLVKLENKYHDDAQFFPTARQLNTDNEFTKFFKFVKRQVNNYMENQGLIFNLPDGAEVIEENNNQLVEEGRGKKKKALVILPLLILFKLFKVKILMALVLASLIFIKKAIMLGALVLPTILQHLKHCSKPEHYHHPTPYHHVEDYHHDHQDDYGGYGKEYQRAYNAYAKTRMS